MRRGGGADCNRYDLEGKKDNDVNYNIEIITTSLEGWMMRSWIPKSSGLEDQSGHGTQRVKTAHETNHDM